MENTATLTIISTSVQAAARLTKGLIDLKDIVLDSIPGDEGGVGAGVRDAAIGPIQRDGHQHEIGVDPRSAKIGVAGADFSVIDDPLLATGGLGVINIRK